MRVHYRALSIAGIWGMAVALSLGLVELRAWGGEKEKESGPTITYSGPEGTVCIKEATIVYVVQEEEFSPGPAAMPSKVVTVTRETRIEATLMKQLLAAIETAGFHNLKDEYGLLKDYSYLRYFECKIQVKDGARLKKVIFRDNYSGTQPPEAFAKVAKLVLETARRETTVRQYGAPPRLKLSPARPH